MILKRKELENIFSIKLKANVEAIGIDTATRTGWCRIATTKSVVKLDYGFFKVKATHKSFTYQKFVELFQGLFDDSFDVVMIEDTYLGRNPKTFKVLSCLGAIGHTMAILAGQKDIRSLTASQARARLGINTNRKDPGTKSVKETIQKRFKAKTGIVLDDDDIVDAIILSLVAIIDENE